MEFNFDVLLVLKEVYHLIPVLVFLAIILVGDTTGTCKPKLGEHLQKRFIVSPYYYKLVQDFEHLAQNLSPSQQYIREGKDVAKKIFEKLKRDGRKYGLKIGRAKIAGSFGKGSGISHMTTTGQRSNPDLDLVVFVNDEVPPFARVFRKFKEILKNDMPEIQYIFVKWYSVEMSVSTPTQGNIQVDLLAAPNRVKNVASWGKQDMGDVEAKLTLLDLEGPEESIVQKSKLLSSCFAVKTVKVIEDHMRDPFVLKVVRLAKFWNAGVKMPSRLHSAKSCMIELIAIYCQRKMTGRRTRNGERCLVSGFRRFLQAMAKLPTLNVILKEEGHKADGGRDITDGSYTLPMVRDPVNSLNNLADGLHPLAIQALVEQATRTLHMLEQFKQKGYYYSVDSAISEIFRHKE